MLKYILVVLLFCAPVLAQYNFTPSANVNAQMDVTVTGNLLKPITANPTTGFSQITFGLSYFQTPPANPTVGANINFLQTQWTQQNANVGITMTPVFTTNNNNTGFNPTMSANVVANLNATFKLNQSLVTMNPVAAATPVFTLGSNQAYTLSPTLAVNTNVIGQFGRVWTVPFSIQPVANVTSKYIIGGTTFTVTVAAVGAVDARSTASGIGVGTNMTVTFAHTGSQIFSPTATSTVALSPANGVGLASQNVTISPALAASIGASFRATATANTLMTVPIFLKNSPPQSLPATLAFTASALPHFNSQTNTAFNVLAVANGAAMAGPVASVSNAAQMVASFTVNHVLSPAINLNANMIATTSTTNTKDFSVQANLLVGGIANFRDGLNTQPVAASTSAAASFGVQKKPVAVVATNMLCVFTVGRAGGKKIMEVI